MGAKDTKAKEFLSDNKRFADLFNYYMFDGKQIIQPSDLCERDTAKVLSVFGTDKKEIYKQKWRDLLKSAIIKTTEYDSSAEYEAVLKYINNYHLHLVISEEISDFSKFQTA